MGGVCERYRPAISHVKNSGTLLGSDRVWANVEKPIEERVPLSILGRAKQLFIEWGVPKERLWVDPDTNTLYYDNNAAIEAKVIDLELKVDFHDDWAEYVKGEEWDKFVNETVGGLDKKRAQFTKGKGKGKGDDYGYGKGGAR